MEKSLVIRCVVPPTVSAPATATASQNSATSALWRSTNRVREGIFGLPGRCQRAFRKALTRLSRCRVQVVVPTATLALPRREHVGTGVLPREYADRQPRDGEEQAARS